MHIHVNNKEKERARNLKSEGVEGMGGAGGRKRSTELIQLYLNKKKSMLTKQVILLLYFHVSSKFSSTFKTQCKLH